MYNYKELGLSNTKEMMNKAYREKYAVPALNFVSIEQFNAIIDACTEKNSPVMLLASPNLHRQLGKEMLARIAQSGVDRSRNEGSNIPIALHLDHGMTFEQCKLAIDYGFSSVMIDGSQLPFEENIALTKKVVEFAHNYDVTVEGELGTLAGQEEEGAHDIDLSNFTDPSMVEEFVKRTGVDSLAISIGTCHGLVKIKPDKNGNLPDLRYDILEDIEKRLDNFPIVLHGASTIMPEYVDMINKYGGNIEQASGIPENQIVKAAKKTVCKINIASDGWIAGLALTRKILHENPSAIDSRIFKLKIRPELAELYKHKIDLMGSGNKA